MRYYIDVGNLTRVIKLSREVDKERRKRRIRSTSIMNKIKKETK